MWNRCIGMNEREEGGERQVPNHSRFSGVGLRVFLLLTTISSYTFVFRFLRELPGYAIGRYRSPLRSFAQPVSAGVYGDL